MKRHQTREAAKQPKAASGAKDRSRSKIRVPGLFGMRHWVEPEHKEQFISGLEALKKKEGLSSNDVLFHVTYAIQDHIIWRIQTKRGGDDAQRQTRRDA